MYTVRVFSWPTSVVGKPVNIAGVVAARGARNLAFVFGFFASNALVREGRAGAANVSGAVYVA